MKEVFTFGENIKRELAGMPPDYVEREGLTPDKVERGLQDVRRRSEDKYAREAELKRHPQELFDVFSRKEYMNIPLNELSFRVENPVVRKYTDKMNDTSTDAILVHTGSMVSVRNDREMLADSFQGCAAVFIQGQDGKSLAHVVSGEDNPNKLGFFQDDTTQVADEIVNSAQNTGELKKAVVIGSKYVKYDEEMLKKFGDSLQRAGVQEVRIERVPVQNFAVFHSSVTQKKLTVIGNKFNSRESVQLQVSI